MHEYKVLYYIYPMLLGHPLQCVNVVKIKHVIVGDQAAHHDIEQLFSSDRILVSFVTEIYFTIFYTVHTLYV